MAVAAWRAAAGTGKRRLDQAGQPAAGRFRDEPINKHGFAGRSIVRKAHRWSTHEDYPRRGNRRGRRGDLLDGAEKEDEDDESGPDRKLLEQRGQVQRRQAMSCARR